MARIATPWFRSERNAWYVCVDGQQHLLGEHPEGAPPPRKVKGKWNAPQPIMQAFHELMARPSAPVVPQTAKGTELTVAELYDKFLDWCQQHRAQRTYTDHRDLIQKFLDESPGVADLGASALRPFHIVEWVGRHATWGDTRRRVAIIAVQRPFNWAEELGYIDSNPIKKIKKPKCQRREQAITVDQWKNIRERYPVRDPFRELLDFCWETGCRPQEARAIEPRHVLLDRMCVAFPPDEAKGKKRWRIIRLTPSAVRLLSKQLELRQEGPVFRNEDGKPWTPYAMNCRFCRLQVAMGKEKMKELGIVVKDEEVVELAKTLCRTRKVKGKRVAKSEAELQREARAKLTVKLARKLGVKHFAYAFRHGFATRKLIEGHDHLTVAELLGHTNGTMLATVYQHLGQHDEHLRKALDDAPKDADA